MVKMSKSKSTSEFLRDIIRRQEQAAAARAVERRTADAAGQLFDEAQRAVPQNPMQVHTFTNTTRADRFSTRWTNVPAPVRPEPPQYYNPAQDIDLDGLFVRARAVGDQMRTRQQEEELLRVQRDAARILAEWAGPPAPAREPVRVEFVTCDGTLHFLSPQNYDELQAFAVDVGIDMDDVTDEDIDILFGSGAKPLRKKKEPEIDLVDKILEDME